MSGLRGWTVGNRVALAGVSACGALAVISLAAALRIAPPAAAPARAPARALPDLPGSWAIGSDSAIVFAVAHSPFRADRKRPPGRYQLPGAAVTAARPAERARRGALPVLQLLGTASFADGRGLAAISVRGGSPRIVRVGQELDGMTLVNVEPGVATLTHPDTTIVLRVAGSAQPRDR